MGLFTAGCLTGGGVLTNDVGLSYVEVLSGWGVAVSNDRT